MKYEKGSDDRREKNNTKQGSIKPRNRYTLFFHLLVLNYKNWTTSEWKKKKARGKIAKGHPHVSIWITLFFRLGAVHARFDFIWISVCAKKVGFFFFYLHEKRDFFYSPTRWRLFWKGCDEDSIYLKASEITKRFLKKWNARSTFEKWSFICKRKFLSRRSKIGAASIRVSARLRKIYDNRGWRLIRHGLCAAWEIEWDGSGSSLRSFSNWNCGAHRPIIKRTLACSSPLD